MGFIADMLHQKAALAALRVENEALKSERDDLKKQLDLMTIKHQLAQELAQDALKTSQLLSREIPPK